MADDFTQDGRTGALATPLGKDVLLLQGFNAIESLGELFEYRIQALSKNPNVDFDQALGRNCSIHLNTVDDVGRDFSGVLVEATHVGVNCSLHLYTLVLRPWLWLLSLTSDCRIFASKTPLDIITQVFRDRGFLQFMNMATGTYPTLEYCVQYRETDLNFVSRLMEEYGIYYYFDHQKGEGDAPADHTLVLIDSKALHKPVPGLSSVPYSPAAVEERRDRQQFDDWRPTRKVRSGRYVLNDYDYEKPGANLLGDAQAASAYERGKMEIYDYPGCYDQKKEGDTLAQVRLDADQAMDKRSLAYGYIPSLLPGYRFQRTSTGAADPDDAEYLVLNCTHNFGYQSYESGANYGGGENYSGTVETMKSDQQFRSPLRTRKSVVQGAQTAKVVGAQGEEIDVDKEGRVLVQFYWDRRKDSSRRVRVGQIWAGKHQRALFIPRIGDEVVVQYLEGDPDRPMVVGSVYNGDNTPPVDLPANKTKSGINTDSSKGHSGHNTFSFDDKVGEEYVHLRAQKNLTVQVLNDETRNVGADQKETIGGKLTQTVGGNLTQTVKGNQTLNVGANGGTYSLTATQEIVLTVGMSSLTITADSISLCSPQINFVAMEELNTLALDISTDADEISTTAASIEVTAAVEVNGGLDVWMMDVIEIEWKLAMGSPPIPPLA